MKLKVLPLALVCAGLVAGTAGATGWNPSQWFQHKTTTSQIQVAAPVSDATTTQENFTPIAPVNAPNYRAIVQRYGPAVVGITVEGSTKAVAESPDMSNDPFFQFFRNMPGFNGQSPQQPHGKVPMRALGSGFIVSSNGIILTNAHVVRDADEVTVKLSDRREYKAKVLGSDKATDVAVLKIDAKDLPIISPGNPAQLDVGDYVLAIGSPFGFEHSATAGIVSAKGRSLPGDGYVPFIQTDVAVNPGNSGGPLFDAAGRVVGINSQIYSETGGFEGISFAIPIDVALNVEQQIVKTGKVVHARLGVSIQDLTQSLAESFKLKQPNGALVSSVTAGSAAAKAGLQPGDVILSYNKHAIQQSGDLPTLVGLSKPGDKANLEIWRGGKTQDLTATLGTATEPLVADASTGDSQDHGKLGVAVRPLTAQEKQESGIASGVIVEQVAGPAEHAGIEAGDVILAVDGTTVKSVQQLQQLIPAKAKHLALLIQRGNEKIFVPVTLG
ncbi:MAG: DegQ family serine endoprotease [Herbaspirillum sp.]